MMNRTPARRLLSTLVLTTALLVGLLPAVAYACSCLDDGPREMLNRSDAAFIGTMADRSGGLFGGDATWTFTVQQWVKGDLGRTVKIRSASSGAACGFELDAGQEAAIFVTVDGDTLRGGLCSTLDADALRAHLGPQPVVNTSPTMLVAASGAGRHLWLFDDRGRLAGTSADARGEYLEDISVCPGGRTVVELWEGRTVVVRDLRTLKTVRRVRGPANIGRLWCRNAEGTRLLGALRDRATGDWASIVDLRQPRQPLLAGDWVSVEIVGDALIAAVGREETQLRRISLADGKDTLLHQATTPAGAVNVEASIEGFSISPDASRVAFEVTNYPASGEPSSDIFVRELSTGRLLARRHVASEGNEVLWMDDSSLLFTSYEDEGLLLDAEHLELEDMLADQVYWPATRAPRGKLIGMDGPRLSALDPRTDRVRTLATIPAEYSTWVLRLPRALKMQVPAGAPDPPPAEPTAPPAPMPGRSAFPQLPPAVLTGLAAVALGLGFVVVRRRARSG